MEENIIELKNIKLSYNKDYCALFDINLEVKKGDRIGIVGETGSGKTALLRLVAGLEKQKLGESYIKGTPIKKINFSRDVSLGYLSTKAVFFERKSVYKNLLWTLKVHKVPKAEREQRIDDILKEFEISHLKKERVGTLCNSDRRLVQIARMAMRPLEIILCDDVLSNDENVTQEKIKTALKKLFDSNPKDKVVLMAGQDENLCKEFVDKIIFIKSGSFINNNEENESINQMENKNIAQKPIDENLDTEIKTSNETKEQEENSEVLQENSAEEVEESEEENSQEIKENNIEEAEKAEQNTPLEKSKIEENGEDIKKNEE